MTPTRHRLQAAAEPRDAELLAGADADSFAEFYRRHARRLAAYLMRATGDAEAAADLTAETHRRAARPAAAAVQACLIHGRGYLTAIPAGLKGGRVNWLGRGGRVGSPGHKLRPL
jgi:hypothetical protein